MSSQRTADIRLPTRPAQRLARLELLHFDIVDGCQLRCLGCPNSALIRKPSFISPELFRRCIRHLDVDRVNVIRLYSFGEPLLHPELETLGRILRDESPFEIGLVELSTNAQSKSYHRIEALTELGVLDRLAISCDGDGTPASYESLRPPAKWEQLMAFLAFARELGQRAPALEIIARSVIRSPEDARRWRDVLGPFGVTPEFRGWKYLPESSRNLTGRTIKMGAGVCFHVGERERLFVNHKGEVVPCCIHPRAGVLGDLGETTHSAILAGPQRRKFVDLMVHDRASMPVCSTCEFGPADNPGPSAGQALGFPA